MKRFTIIVFAYVLIIAGSMFISSRITSESIYDKYLINSEGFVIPYSDFSKAIVFYRDILNFKPFYKESFQKEEKNIVGFFISKHSRIFLAPKNDYYPAASPANSTVVIRVRNGFKKLHDAIVQNSENSTEIFVTPENYLNIVERGRISSIVRLPWGREFVAYDYDGNKIIYLEPKRRSRSIQ